MVPILEISAESLCQRLENGQAVSVLDIRPLSQRAESLIPGSLHWDVYEALKVRDKSILAGLHLDKNIPVIAYCAGGKSSLIAAEMLRQQGYDAWSLAGGMRAWQQLCAKAEISTTHLAKP